jgi:hypothetical protein
MGTTGHHGYQSQSGYLPGNPTEHHYAPADIFSDNSDLSTAKIINNFEAKNPLKYPNKQDRAFVRGTGDYQYPHLPPPHNYPPLYQNHTKIPSYEPYPRISPRNNVPHYPTQPYSNSHSMDVGVQQSSCCFAPSLSHLTPSPATTPSKQLWKHLQQFTPLPYDATLPILSANALWKSTVKKR